MSSLARTSNVPVSMPGTGLGGRLTLGVLAICVLGVAAILALPSGWPQWLLGGLTLVLVLVVGGYGWWALASIGPSSTGRQGMRLAFWKHWSFTTRVYVLVGFSVLAMGIGTAIAVMTLYYADVAVMDDAQVAGNLLHMKDVEIAQQQQVAILQAVHRGAPLDPHLVTAFRRSRQKIDEALHALASSSAPRSLTLARQLAQPLAQLQTVGWQMVGLAQSGQTAAAEQVYRQDFAPANERYTAFFQALLRGQQQALSHASGANHSVIAGVRSFLVVTGLLAMLVVLVVGMSSVATLARILQRLRQTIQKVEQGDLRITLPLASPGALDQIITAVNSLIRQLTGITGEIGSTAHGLIDSSQTLAQSTEVVTSHLQRSRAEISTVRSAMVDLATRAAEVVRYANTIAQTAQHANDEATHGGGVIAATLEGMEEILRGMQDASVTVEQLTRSAERIGGIVATIREIADQTNLLALNAAIEAARAGEKGRGFAVVADEVRKLAERSSAATRDVSAMIGSLQGAARSAVQAMGEGQKRVQRGASQAHDAGLALTRITDATTEVASQVAAVVDAAENQDQVSAGIVKNLDHVVAGAESIVDVMVQTRSEAQTLQATAEHLQGLVNHFKLAKG
ncbi:MAG: methyl-accepting chemotaxis protein [Acidithiobacillus sp.]